MLKDIIWPDDRSFRTGIDNEPLQFYLDCLISSKQADLLLGYFSSSVIHVLSPAFATFLYNGGTIRLVINNVLSELDKTAILDGRYRRVEKDLLDLSDIKKLKSSLSDYGTHFFNCLAWLIANDKIQIKVIEPKNGKGIAHYKSGIFSDGTNSVGFKASCNFTAYGLLENLEELDAFLSWENARSSKMLKNQKAYFDLIFSEKADFVKYVNIDDVSTDIKKEFGNKNLSELIINEKDLLEKLNRKLENKYIKKTIERVIFRIDETAREPKFPYSGGPRPYQIEAFDNWKKNGYKGIFAMATGTGKTITSLNCLLNEYKTTKSYKAVILVPTIALLEQWKVECQKFNFKNIITISSKINWNNELSFFNTADKLSPTSFIVIATYASFTRPKFQSHFKQLPFDTLLIADEVHNMGSSSIQKILPHIHIQKRIGLSATPHRKFDEDGNSAIQQFFTDQPPFIFSYTMEQALKLGWLCPYTYFPHIVELNDDELKEYIRISKQLLKYLDSQTHTYKDLPEVDFLLLARKRIIHKAAKKLNVFREVLREEFRKRKNLKYTLVYVPEGVEPIYSDVDTSSENDEDIKLINEYTKAISATDESLMVRQFTANTKERDNLLNEYADGKIDVLTSMKCLDEGVDVPRSELAIFCASTGNPRQFIQRRGRVLRLANGKNIATIHDLVVIPKIDAKENNYDMERNLVKRELERVMDFATLAINKADTYEELKGILDYYNLNMNDFVN